MPDTQSKNETFTEGPWNFHQYYDPFEGPVGTVNGFDYWNCTIAKGDKILGTASYQTGAGGVPKVENLEEAKANAHLMVAAPELFEALNLMLGRYTELINCGDCGSWDPEKEDEVIAGRVAIAKALGQ